MPKYVKLKPLEPDEEYKKGSIHWNKREWNDVLEVAGYLKLNDLSSVVKECIKLALIYLRFKQKIIQDLKKRIKEFDLKSYELFER